MDEVTDATFADLVLTSSVPVVVQFTAPWCRPCRHVEPVLRGLAEDHAGRVRVVALDVDTNLQTPSRYGVLTVPTVMLFAGGEPRATVLGAHPRRRYDEAFAAVLG
ncbi:MAG: thiol reductase thioredoxin [Thermoleophilia bacterium]|nr:thiol reductase thioredoxin [Thermoleophilia bacterium]